MHSFGLKAKHKLKAFVLFTAPPQQISCRYSATHLKFYNGFAGNFVFKRQQIQLLFAIIDSFGFLFD
jgi:hypothetical protein